MSRTPARGLLRGAAQHQDRFLFWLMNPPPVFFQNLQLDGPPHLSLCHQRSSRVDLGLLPRNRAFSSSWSDQSLQIHEAEPADETGTGSHFLLPSPRQPNSGGQGSTEVPLEQKRSCGNEHASVTGRQPDLYWFKGPPRVQSMMIHSFHQLFDFFAVVVSTTTTTTTRVRSLLVFSAFQVLENLCEDFDRHYTYIPWPLTLTLTLTLQLTS